MKRVSAVILSAALVAAAATGAGASPRPSIPAVPIPGDPGLFLNILPPGQGSSTTSTGQAPPHTDDQLGMYDALISAPTITDANLTDFYKPETFQNLGTIERTEDPSPGLSILRDSFGVPHIYGNSRAKAMFGAGYVMAEDRLFLADVLRHVGRGRLSELLGPTEANLAMDRDTYLVAGYDEGELNQQIKKLEQFGPPGKQVVEDGKDFVQGINARIEEDLQNPTQMPAEYPALQIVPEKWRPSDVVAVAILIQATFAAGGGRELASADFLQRAQEKLGAAAGLTLWKDVREAEDPEAPVTADASFPFMAPAHVDPAAVAMPDPGYVRPFDPIHTTPAPSSPPAPGLSRWMSLSPLDRFRSGLARIGLDLPGAESNWIAVTRQHTASGHPIAVMGPQTGYFAPEILMEEDLHAPGLDTRGATFPGLNLYILLGRGKDFAWSATSGDSNLVDIRAEKLCEPDGSEPTLTSTSYVFDGTCRQMYVRVDQWVAKPTAGGIGDPQLVKAFVHRTVHGPVVAVGRVDGQPVAFTQQRTTFFGELDSAPAFVLLNDNTVNSPQSFQHAMDYVTGSFNWLYVDSRHVGYYHSGKYPIAAAGVDPNFPSWGTGQWEWRGFVPFSGHPRAIDPAKGWIDSWNNKPAHAWRSADGQWAWGSVHRVEALSDRLAATVPAGGVHPSDMVRIIKEAATLDLRGQEVLPLLLRIIGHEPQFQQYLDILKAWVASGAHRLDADRNGQYDDHAAVALMDAWWPNLIHFMFDHQLDGLYDSVPMGFDDHPGPVGSAFIDGYYGYVEKAARMVLGDPVRGPFTELRCQDGSRGVCQAALVKSLAATLQQIGTDPTQWDDHAASDMIAFQAVGLVSVPNTRWQNRPTFQQVVEVTEPPQP